MIKRLINKYCMQLDERSTRMLDAAIERGYFAERHMKANGFGWIARKLIIAQLKVDSEWSHWYVSESGVEFINMPAKDLQRIRRLHGPLEIRFCPRGLEPI